jgi:DNA-binding response OmpR family regulator
MSVEPRLLIVDDEEVICQSCKRILASRGFRVETCTDPQIGLQMAQQNGYDAIVLDVRMPGINGIRFLEHLREIHIQVPVVVMSGRAGEAAAEAVARLGAAEYLAKPFTPDEITQAVRRSLAAR